MTVVASVVLGVLAGMLLVPALVLLVECVLSLFSTRASPPRPAPRPRVALLVPAHDEEAIIDRTVRALLPELTEGDRLVVVADNCIDATADRARTAGALVVERFDAERRGKGYALAHGVEWLKSEPPDVVVIIDADCAISKGGVERLAGEASLRNRPVQARNTLLRMSGSSPLASISAFAFLVKNVVRARGLSVLRLPIHLAGTGMAFPWPLLSSTSLATGALAEDLQLGVDLAIAGHPAVLCLDAAVTSPMPVHERASVEQRKRWEYGHLSTLFSRVPRLFWFGLRKRRLGLVGMALDLCVPPLALLVLASVLLSAVALPAALLGASWTPVMLASGTLVAVVLGIAIAWARDGRKELPFRDLLRAPAYVFKKLPMYLGFTRRRQRRWVRTERAPDPRDERP